jgi:hypothetical protein
LDLGHGYLSPAIVLQFEQEGTRGHYTTKAWCFRQKPDAMIAETADAEIKSLLHNKPDASGV